MIKINLLPFRAARKKENIRQQVSIFVMGLILVLLCLGWYHFALMSEITDLNEKIQKTDIELAAYKKKVEEVKKLEKELSVLQKKMDVMAKLDLNRKAPVRLLDEMTQMIVPDQMWLDTMQVTAKGVLVVKGVSTDNQTVADFMVNLEKSPLFDTVNLDTIDQEKKNKLNLKSFSINATLVPLGETSKAKAKK